MNNCFRKSVSVFLIVFVLFSIVALSGCEEQKLNPTEKFFVNDFADVLDDSAEDNIKKQGEKLDTETTAQVVIVTIDTTDGQEISEYSADLANDWGIGNKEKDNGVLILLAVEDRNVFIATGEGIESALPASKVGRILDYYATPDFREDKFQEGLLKTYKAVVDEVYVEYGITPENYHSADELVIDSSTEESSPKTIMISWAIMLVLILLYTLIFRRRGIMFIPINFGGNNFRGGGFGGGFGGSGGFSGGGGSFGGGGAGRGF